MILFSEGGGGEGGGGMWGIHLLHAAQSHRVNSESQKLARSQMERAN